jgi:hypothetical protein
MISRVRLAACGNPGTLEIQNLEGISKSGLGDLPFREEKTDPFGRRGGLLQGSLLEVSLALVGVASPA